MAAPDARRVWSERVTVRPERQRDHASVRAVNTSAFETAAEADLVDALREQADPVISLVAEEGYEAVGHIMFSPVSHDRYEFLHGLEWSGIQECAGRTAPGSVGRKGA